MFSPARLFCVAASFFNRSIRLCRSDSGCLSRSVVSFVVLIIARYVIANVLWCLRSPFYAISLWVCVCRSGAREVTEDCLGSLLLRSAASGMCSLIVSGLFAGHPKVDGDVPSYRLLLGSGISEQDNGL